MYSFAFARVHTLGLRVHTLYMYNDDPLYYEYEYFDKDPSRVQMEGAVWSSDGRGWGREASRTPPSPTKFVKFGRP